MPSNREWLQASYFLSIVILVPFSNRIFFCLWKLNLFLNFRQRFCLMLSYNGHNLCSVYRLETHEYWPKNLGKMSTCLVFKVLEFSFRILVKIQNSQFALNQSCSEFQQHLSTSRRHISWTIGHMKAREYPMKPSISFLFNSWPESNLNSTNFMFSNCCLQSR
jgi:hypothetical protein